MIELKRYDPVSFSHCGGKSSGSVEEDIDGDYVSFEDHKEIEDNLLAELEAMTKQRDELREMLRKMTEAYDSIGGSYAYFINDSMKLIKGENENDI